MKKKELEDDRKPRSIEDVMDKQALEQLDDAHEKAAKEDDEPDESEE